jgi:elongation factor Tu
MDSRPHLHARIKLATTENGGRHSPIFSGYRPQFRYLERDNDVSVTLHEADSASPGECVSVNLTFFRPELQRNRLYVGAAFTLAEGARDVASGVVLEIYDSTMLSGADTQPTCP